jgi:tryptophan synthase alpha chain
MPESPQPGAGRLESAIRERMALGHPALSAFFTAGYPTMAGFAGLLQRAASVSTVIEVGVPFTDPLADGITIQASSRVALENGVTLPWIFDTLSRASLTRPVVIMSYANPLLAYGLDALAADAKQAGVAGMIVPDLPYEECRQLRRALDSESIALVQLVTPITPMHRVARLCDASRGFVYAVTMTGTTGSAATPSPDVLAYLDRVKEASTVPVLAGFGISKRSQVDALAPHVDGVIVGSALIQLIEQGKDPVALLRTLVTDGTEETE